MAHFVTYWFVPAICGFAVANLILVLLRNNRWMDGHFPTMVASVLGIAVLLEMQGKAKRDKQA